MRSRHGRAAKKPVGIIGSVKAGTGVCARGCDVGLDPAASIDDNRSAVAKESYDVGTRVQSSGGVCGLINRGRTYDSRTVWPLIMRSDHHHDASRALSFDSGLQSFGRTAILRAATPRVVSDIWRFGGVFLPAT